MQHSSGDFFFLKKKKEFQNETKTFVFPQEKEENSTDHNSIVEIVIGKIIPPQVIFSSLAQKFRGDMNGF